MDGLFRRRFLKLIGLGRAELERKVVALGRACAGFSLGSEPAGIGARARRGMPWEKGSREATFCRRFPGMAYSSPRAAPGPGPEAGPGLYRGGEAPRPSLTCMYRGVFNAKGVLRVRSAPKGKASCWFHRTTGAACDRGRRPGMPVEALLRTQTGRALFARQPAGRGPWASLRRVRLPGHRRARLCQREDPHRDMEKKDEGPVFRSGVVFCGQALTCRRGTLPRGGPRAHGLRRPRPRLAALAAILPAPRRDFPARIELAANAHRGVGVAFVAGRGRPAWTTRFQAADGRPAARLGGTVRQTRGARLGTGA